MFRRLVAGLMVFSVSNGVRHDTIEMGILASITQTPVNEENGKKGAEVKVKNEATWSAAWEECEFSKKNFDDEFAAVKGKTCKIVNDCSAAGDEIMTCGTDCDMALIAASWVHPYIPMDALTLEKEAPPPPKVEVKEKEVVERPMDYLPLLYKYCFSEAFARAARITDDSTPLIKKDSCTETDVSQIDFADGFSVKGIYMFLRKDFFDCSIKITDETANQQDIAAMDADFSKIPKGYKGRPETSWFKLGVDGADKENVDKALLWLVKDAVNQDNADPATFHMRDWSIKGECKDSTGQSTMCVNVLKSGKGKFTFEAETTYKSSTFGRGIPTTELDAKEVVSAFAQTCEQSMNAGDSKYAGISNKFCADKENFKCGGKEQCSQGGQIVDSVGWDGAGFHWK